MPRGDLRGRSRNRLRITVTEPDSANRVETMRALSTLLVLLLTLAAAAPTGAEIRSRAMVQSDGTLKVGQQTIRLHGIYIPPTNRVCRTFRRPTRCASRAVLALDTRVDRFVVCETVARLSDGSRSAVCRIRDRRDSLGPEVDLSAWMLYHGWAVAAPGAPFEYVTLERIAQQHERGIWGFQVDSIIFR